jgi:hypothetical protein
MLVLKMVPRTIVLALFVLFMVETHATVATLLRQGHAALSVALEFGEMVLVYDAAQRWYRRLQSLLSGPEVQRYWEKVMLANIDGKSPRKAAVRLAVEFAHRARVEYPLDKATTAHHEAVCRWLSREVDAYRETWASDLRKSDAAKIINMALGLYHCPDPFEDFASFMMEQRSQGGF